MRTCLGLLALVLWTGPSISYFKYQRPVESTGAGQNYFVVDETVWEHARPDLGDLRVFAGQTETPYIVQVERGSLEQDHQDVRVLQQSSVGGKTQFLIDMSGIAEYDHVSLRLTTRDFVAHAKVEGQDDLHGRQWASLGDTSLYDFSKEKLGSSSVLRLPRSTYRYLRVTIDGPVKPADVTGATSEVHQEEKPLWRVVNAQYQTGTPPFKTKHKNPQLVVCPPAPKSTYYAFDVSANEPVERVVFDIDPAQTNFRREVTIEDETCRIIGSGEINRIHMVRAGRKIDSEQHEVNLSAVGPQAIVINIYNGDDPPLKITGAHLQQHERRVYLDTTAANPLTLYYGDEKLDSPVYDYAKLFQKDKAAIAAKLGPESSNTAYTERPDERPWSERHPAVLWIAIVGAVAVLGALALRSMKATSAQ